MVFKCQEDSYLKEWTAQVKSCKEVQLAELGVSRAFCVILDDTILFPEGGGQPSDEGTLGGLAVLKVERRGKEVLHYVPSPLPEGARVQLSVDWERRFDHMQQHSGQHLLSAVLEREHMLPTTAWWLGASECYVEVPGSPEQVRGALEDAQRRCNFLIRQALPVNVRTLPPGQGPPGLRAGLPEDQREGPLRVVTISQLDDNPCCGTHVSNLSQLQAITVLGAEAGKKHKTNIRFLVGGRVLARLQTTLERENVLTRLLKGEAAQHALLVEKLQRAAREATALAEEVAQLSLAGARPPYALVHRERGAPPLASLARAAQRCAVAPDTLLLLSSGDAFSVQGPPEPVRALGPQVCSILEGRGAPSADGRRFQGKATRMAAISQCHALVRDYFQHA